MNFDIEPDFEQDLSPLTEDDMKNLKRIEKNATYRSSDYEQFTQRVLLVACDIVFGYQLEEVLKCLHPRYRVWFIDKVNYRNEDAIFDSLSHKALLNLCKAGHGNIRKMLTRLPAEYLHEFIDHEDGGVRHTVSECIDPSYLPRMMDDENEHVRINVIKKIDPSYLPEMMVKYGTTWCAAVIAERIDPGYLFYFMRDKRHDIRLLVAKRIDSYYLPEMMNDESRPVRAEVARRINPMLLGPMLGDPTSEVRDIAYERIPQEYVPKRYMKKFNERVAKFVMEK